MSSTSRCVGGSKPKSLKLSSSTCGPCSESPKADSKCLHRTLQSTVESGGRAGYDGAKRRKGNKVHLAVDTLGHLLVLCVTAASEQDRARVAELAERVQSETGETVEIAYVDRSEGVV